METKTITFGQSGSRPYGVLTVTETATNNTANTSTVSITLTLKRPHTYTSTTTKHASCTINGTEYTWSGKIGSGVTGDLLLISKTQTIPHNSDGSKTISISAWIELKLQWSDGYIDTISGSGTMPLTTLKLYPTVNHSVLSKTETSITMKWSSNSTIDYLWYSKNNGSSWTGLNIADGTNGTYTISGLTANTSYNIKTRLRRKDSQLTSDSTALTVATYAYPYASSMPNFVIGNMLTIGLYNPLKRSVTVNLIGADNSQISNDTTTGMNISGFTATTIVNSLYASIPNAKSGTYKVKVTYSGNVTTKTGGTYSVNADVCAPTISGATYQDTSLEVIAVTGDASKIVQNQSIVRYNATVGANNSATISSCKVVVNNSTINLNVAGTSAEGGYETINSSMNVTARYTVTDSRGLTASTDVQVQMLGWSEPTAIITLKRVSNYYSETNILVDADYSYLGGGNAIDIKYRTKKVEDSTWGQYVSLQDNVQSTLIADNEYEWDVEIVLTDLLGGTTTYTRRLPIGMPIAYFDGKKLSVGIGTFPTEEKSLEIADSTSRTLLKKDEVTLISGTRKNTITPTSMSYVRNGNTVELTNAIRLYDTEDTSSGDPYNYAMLAPGALAFYEDGTSRMNISRGGISMSDGTYAKSITPSGPAVSGDNSSTDASVPSGTLTNITSFTLTPGTYLITAQVRFPNNASGYRQIGIRTNTTSIYPNINREFLASSAPASGTLTVLSVAGVQTITQSSITLYLNAYQTSGSTLACSWAYHYVKLA